MATATITVTDVNDNAPKFSRTSFSASISENSPAGTPLQLYLGQQINVTDIDEVTAKWYIDWLSPISFSFSLGACVGCGEECVVGGGFFLPLAYTISLF